MCVGEALIPYYTGKAINGIVVHQSMEYFTKPLLMLSALALARYDSLSLWSLRSHSGASIYLLFRHLAGIKVTYSELFRVLVI